MPPFGRRQFLGTSFGSLAAAMAAGPTVLGAEPARVEKAKEPKEVAPEFTPTAQNTLFLTWQRDPTTTMTVQWVGRRRRPAGDFLRPRPDHPYRRNRHRPRLADGPDRRQAVPAHRPQGLPRRADRPDAGHRLPVPHRQAARRPTASAPCRPRRPTRSTSSPAATAASTPTRWPTTSRSRPGRTRCSPSSAATWATTTASRSRSASPSCATTASTWSTASGRLIPMVACIGNHEVDGGYNKPREGRPVLLRPVRRPVPRHRLRHARLRRLPEPGAARHRPHRPDRRRPDRLAGQGARRRGRTSRT